MTLKEIIKEKALELEFEDAGFTGVEPLDYYIREIDSRPREMYNWVQTDNFNTRRGAGVGQKHKWAGSLVVLIRNYHRRILCFLLTFQPTALLIPIHFNPLVA